jgi:hypothetical protein
MTTPPATTGPLGKQRGIGFGILMFIVTLEIQGALNRYWESKAVASAAGPAPAV